ncbi:hypothetical protein DENIS_1338 [Desulfonema ishimotonii]|uniref:Uncharacterized protein n=1 Tax=Desulfonema ishimotonii TaxID=45657 RepID=A0A401FTU3_9BACT|nr:hypothetical protein [Desulfonema ishimotonii]GBC60386.1 hypothetical protein DENIS_1338 [Desulfonema ishimotonii]
MVSDACPLADAAATAIGNQVKSKKHIRRAIDFGSQIDGVRGLVVIVDDQIGMWGEIEIVPLRGKMG